MQIETSTPVQFTISAKTELLRLMSEEGFDHTKQLRVGVKGGGCSGMTYILDFDELKPNDQKYQLDELAFIMDKSHGIYLQGMEIDWQGGLNDRGFTFKNPNASSTCGCGTSFAV